MFAYRFRLSTTHKVSGDEWKEKLADLGSAIDSEKDVYVRHCFWLLLLTGMRRGELLNTKWEDIDLAQKRIWLPETKSGQPRYVHLSTGAVELIKETPRMLKNDFCSPSNKASGTL